MCHTIGQKSLRFQIISVYFSKDKDKGLFLLRSGHYGGGSDVIARYDGYIAQQLHQKKRWRRSII